MGAPTLSQLVQIPQGFVVVMGQVSNVYHLLQHLYLNEKHFHLLGTICSQFCTANHHPVSKAFADFKTDLYCVCACMCGCYGTRVAERERMILTLLLLVFVFEVHYHLYVY